MRSKSIKKIIRKLSRKIICVNDSRYIKFKNFSILIGIFIFIILSTVSDVGAATVGKTIISAPTDPLRNGLVGWWTFDGNNMINNVTDSSGRGNNGYLVNMSTTSAVTAGNIGQALNFDGINDYVRVPPSSSLNDLGPLTYSAWVYLPVGAGSENDLVTKRRRIFALTNLQSPATLYFITSNDAINTSARSTTAISLKQWTHVAVVWNGQIGGGFSCDFYINGVVTGKVVFNTGSNNVLSDTSFDLTIGAFTGGTSGFVNGKIDDVRVYNRMLSASEMKLLYSYGVAKVASTISRPAQTGLTSGLVGHWTFDGKNMISNVADSSGSGNNGKMSGFTSTSTAVRTGISGQALIFDGVNDSVDLTNTASQNNPMTSCSWVNPKDLSTMSSGYGGGILRSFTNTNGAAGDFWYGVTNSGYIKFSYYKSLADTTGLISYNGQSPVLTANKWYHVCVSWDGSAQSVYINGIKQSGAVTTTNAGGGWGTGAYIGKIYAAGAYQFNGSIDDVRLYNRQLSDSEIKQIYSQGSAKVASTVSRPPQTGLTSGLVGHWTFDGKNMISNVADSSGNGNNGMMSGFTSTSSAVTAGKVGQGLRFDGSNDIVTASQNTITNYPFTLSIWAKPSSISSQQYAISYALNSSNVVFYAIGLNGDKAYIYSRSSTPEEGSATGAISLKNDKWVHLVGIFNSATDKRVYVDGVQHALLSTSIPFVSANTAGFGVLARSSQFGYWNGLLDDARVYNRALTDSEITQIYNAGK